MQLERNSNIIKFRLAFTSVKMTLKSIKLIGNINNYYCKLEKLTCNNNNTSLLANIIQTINLKTYPEISICIFLLIIQVKSSSKDKCCYNPCIKPVTLGTTIGPKGPGRTEKVDMSSGEVNCLSC